MFHLTLQIDFRLPCVGSICDEYNKVAQEAQPSASLMFSPHFDVSRDLLLYRPMAIFIYLFHIIKKQSVAHDDVTCASVL